MYRCVAAAFAGALVTLAAPASAQLLRAFPPEALRGALVIGDYPAVTLNGKAATLSPGTRIRGANNMLVMAPTIVGAKLLVHYTLDNGASDRIRDVWILTPDEAAVKPWPTTLEEARTWTFDPLSRTWTKPWQRPRKRSASRPSVAR